MPVLGKCIIAENFDELGGSFSSYSNSAESAGVGYTSSCIRISDNSFAVKDISADNLDEGALSLCAYAQYSGSGDKPFVSLLDDSDNVIAQITVENSSEHYKFEYDNGSGLTKVGATQTALSLDTARRIDFEWKLHDTEGYLRVAINGGTVWEVTGDTLLIGASIVSKFRIGGAGSNCYYWACLWGDESLRLFHWTDRQASTYGNHQESEGIYQYTDELFGAPSHSDFATFDAVGERLDLNYQAFPVAMAAWEVVEVNLLFWAKALTDGAMRFQPYVRIGTTDYDVSSIQSPAAGVFQPFMCPFVNDPSTGVPFVDTAAVDAATVGVRSLAAA